VLRTSLQGCALLVLVPAILGRDHPVRRALSLPPALVVGRLSYSLYLWHWGGFALADFLAGANRALWFAVALPAATTLAGLSYACIERPMLRWRRRAGSEAPFGIR
jgi:peptidoglycan/LPS O-acetylase OafA/YrhL